MTQHRERPARRLRAESAPSPRAGQTGAALATVVVMLVLVMLLAYSAARISGNQLRTAGNEQFQSIALNRAETGVANGETWLGTVANNANISSVGFRERNLATPQLYPQGFMAANGLDPLSMDWNATNSLGVDATTRYLIELVASSKSLPGDNTDMDSVRVGPCRKMSVFRVVSRGGGDRGAERLVESLYAVPNCV